MQDETNYTGTELYNGNISETYWRTASDNVLRKYGYEYDTLNRLTNAIYQKPESAVVVTNSYNESLTYDKNGNITGLNRSGEYDDTTSNLIIDNLTYNYSTVNPNQLNKVTDATTNPNGFKDVVGSGNDYSYDANGNMTVDINKGIQIITYNHLNLPTKITFGNANYIVYVYDAYGQKILKIVKNETAITTTDYLDGFQYVNNVLELFPHAEGYVKNTLMDGSLKINYAFNYTDHLGNIRITYGIDPYNSALTIMEENNYYPFGLNHKNYNIDRRTYGANGGGIRLNPLCALCDGKYKYKYNGKEYQDELGLNMYDFKARNYDPAIGRWMNMDPLAEQYRRWSPYNYCMNNPVIFTDPDGMYVDTAFIYQKDKKGNYANKAMVKAFETFAKSKEGIAFLANFAEEGQVIAGHEYKDGGKFDKKDIDLKFDKLDEDSIADADTGTEKKGNGIEITIGLSPTATKVDTIIDDIGHEAFLHADSEANDFYDDKKLNLSNIDKDIVKNLKDHNYSKKWTPNAAQHQHGRRHEILNKKLVPILRNYYKNSNIKKTDAEIKESVNSHMD